MDSAVLQRALDRERKRRAAAEALLEEKSRELYHSYAELEETLEALRRNKDALVQNEKMASLGVMSAGVAHEINNPIGFVQSNLNTLSEYPPVFAKLVNLARTLADTAAGTDAAAEFRKFVEDEDVEFILQDTCDIIDESRDGVARVREIVAGLKAFSHMDKDAHTEVNVNEVLTSTLTIARSQVKHDARLDETLGDLPPISGSAGPLGQVFLNLIVNAAQALDDEGGVINVQSEADATHVIVTVADNGCGISPENQQRLFEPFFTTKDVGEGTGLGLSISHGIVCDHQGTISCQSEPGVGTTFTVLLPIKQAIKQAIEQTIDQPIERTIEQTTEPTSAQAP